MARPKRIYQPAWELLREKKKLKLVVPKHAHRTVIRMILKERYKDLEYKFGLAEANKRGRIEYQIEGTEICFVLHEELTCDGI